MRWRLPGHAGPLVPVWAVGTLLLWEVTECSELPSGPRRRALAGLSAVGTQDLECTATPPTHPPAAAAGLTGAGYPASPGVRSGCTSAMQSLPDSSNKPALLADLPLHGLRGALSGPLGRVLSLAFHLTQTAGALQSSLQMAGKRWDPGGRDTGLWVAEGRVTAC